MRKLESWPSVFLLLEHCTSVPGLLKQSATDEVARQQKCIFSQLSGVDFF